AVGDVSGLVAHASCRAARTHATLFAREGHQHLVAASVAVKAYEAPRKIATRQVLGECVLDVLRQRACVLGARMLEKVPQVLADDAPEQRLLRLSGAIRGAGHAARF